MASGSQGTQGYAVGEEAIPRPNVWFPASGRVIFQGMIETRCYPWKAPKTSLHGGVRKSKQSRSYQVWKSWETDIAMVLMPLYRLTTGGKILDGPVDLDLLFVVETGRTPADRTNLGKSLEDIFQGIFYVNDTQVRGGDIRRVFLGEPVYGWEGLRWEGPERVHFRVTSLG
jgi:hypothetical protein